MNDTEFEPPPPGAGFKTVTTAVPAVAMSLAGIAAERLVPLTNVVVRGELFHRTTEPEMKLLPLTVSVKPAPPAVAEFGLRLLTDGTGFGGVTVNVTPFEAPPPGPGLNTVTVRGPEVEMSLAGIAAVRLVVLPNVVVRFAPCQRTMEPETKPLPVTVKVNAPPSSTAELGLMPEITGTGLGTGLLMVKVTWFEPVPPLKT